MYDDTPSVIILFKK